jgi:lipid-A-disaccharide synthase
MTSERPLHVALVAGEASGDALGAGLMEALARRAPGVRFSGICGPRMEALGCRSAYPMERLSVMGFAEVAGRLPELLAQRRRLARELLADPPDVFVGVDAPDYNLALEARLRAAGVPTVHYVSPTVWAWRRGRIRGIARAVDRMLALFPFEAELYAAHGVPATFVGHPLADAIPLADQRAHARAALGVASDAQAVALLPGSRESELKHLGPAMAATAARLHAERPGLALVAPMATPTLEARFRAHLGRAGDPPVRLLAGRSQEAMAAADVVLLASGTAALEALLLKRPMVVCYRVARLTAALVRPLMAVEHFSMPNHLAGRGLVPELIQEDAVPERMVPAVLRYLDDPEAAREVTRAADAIHRRLRRDASERAAEAVLEVARAMPPPL